MKKINMAAMPKIKTIEVSANNRYWDDGEVNGEQDTEDGTLMPCKNGDNWCPVIDAETGIIKDWPNGTTARVHYKVVDGFSAKFLDANGGTVVEIEEEYVPDFMSPKEEGFGDYIIMDIDSDGKIADWEFRDDMVTNDLHEDDD